MDFFLRRYHRGSVTLLQCAAHNFSGLLACRFFMGIFEAGFFGKWCIDTISDKATLERKLILI